MLALLMSGLEILGASLLFGVFLALIAAGLIMASGPFIVAGKHQPTRRGR